MQDPWCWRRQSWSELAPATVRGTSSRWVFVLREKGNRELGGSDGDGVHHRDDDGGGRERRRRGVAESSKLGLTVSDFEREGERRRRLRVVVSGGWYDGDSREQRRRVQVVVSGSGFRIREPTERESNLGGRKLNLENKCHPLIQNGFND